MLSVMDGIELLSTSTYQEVEGAQALSLGLVMCGTAAVESRWMVYHSAPSQ